MNDWIAMLQKYGTPVFSVTRSEWLREVDADGFIFPAPAQIDQAKADVILEKLKSGIPILFTGQSGLLQNGLRMALDIDVEEEAITSEFPLAAVVDDKLARRIETFGLAINQRQRTLKANAKWDSFIQCFENPVFA